MAILGLDIGGANIKAADPSGRAVSRPFAIWRNREQLRSELASILQEFPQTDQIAVTMTAELADCFATKSEGVRFILDAVQTCAESFSSDNASSITSPTRDDVPNVVVWSTEGHFVTPRQASDFIRRVAAGNWHALATWCGRYSPSRPGLLIDIGTTTTDIIPLVDGRPVPVGLTDVARLQSGELAYSGVWRTPLCAVAHSVPFRGGYCTLAAELFATMLDVNLLLNRIKENDQNCDTANGKPATKAAAHDRIARTLCSDRHEVTFDEATEIAKFLADVQRQRLAGALERVVQRLPAACESVIISGSGSFLAHQLIYESRHTSNAKVISLSEKLTPKIAEAACAYAIAQLATETSLKRGIIADPD
jgi:probable H4MPT-linked C1 transfer pathway protein